MYSTVVLSALAILSTARAGFIPFFPIKTCTVKALGQDKDDGPNIQAAFDKCSKDAIIELTGDYTVGTVLNTTTLENVEINWTGTVTYTPDIDYWSPASYFLTYQNATTAWLLGGKNIWLHGGGTLDGNGQVWWNYFKVNGSAGVAGGSSRLFARPVPLTLFNASNVLIDGLHIVQSPFWHNFVYQSENVIYNDITLSSVSDNVSVTASNTDGWDIYRSNNVAITNSIINNGDDCVSFKPNTTNALVYNLNCNGSHGISVGSLGQYAGETDIVANVYISDIVMANAQNGARIKVFGGSDDPNSVSGGGTGYVQNITFQNFEVQNTDYPILLTQCYETTTAQCEAFPATLTISDVHYINVHGTSSGNEGKTVVTLECSNPCKDITAAGTNITDPTGGEQYLCANLVDPALVDFNCTDVAL